MAKSFYFFNQNLNIKKTKKHPNKNQKAVQNCIFGAKIANFRHSTPAFDDFARKMRRNH
jgi:hypothetical protein